MIDKTKTEYFNVTFSSATHRKTGKRYRAMFLNYHAHQFLVLDRPLYGMRDDFSLYDAKLRVSLKRTRHAQKFRMVKDGYNRYLTDQSGKFEFYRDCILLRHGYEPAFPELEDDDVDVWLTVSRVNK